MVPARRTRNAAPLMVSSPAAQEPGVGVDEATDRASRDVADRVGVHERPALEHRDRVRAQLGRQSFAWGPGCSDRPSRLAADRPASAARLTRPADLSSVVPHAEVVLSPDTPNRRFRDLKDADKVAGTTFEAEPSGAPISNDSRTGSRTARSFSIVKSAATGARSGPFNGTANEIK